MENLDSSPLYNSRIIQTYIDYIRTTYPAIQINNILEQAEIKKDEINDPGHWFTQNQVDRFHDVIVALTGDKHISRHAGRFSASAKGIGLLKQYILGLMNIETVFDSTTKLMPLLTKGATVKGKRLGIRTVEIISTPNPGVQEKSYQCESRFGIIETLPKLFTNNYADIEHPQCFHQGDDYCRYIVRWTTSPSIKLKIVRNYSFFGILLLIVGFFTLPITAIPLSTSIVVSLILITSLAYSHQKTKELEKVIDYYHETAQEQMQSVNINYDNALLVQEIGQATAAIFDIDELMNKLASLLQKHLPFDRGLILLADEAGSHLVFSAGYGYSQEELEQLQDSVFRLNNPDAKGAFIRAFHDQKYFVINDLNSIEGDLSARSRAMAKKFGVVSLLCVPILFKQRSLGILAVDHHQTKTSYKKSDVNLLQGIAAHIAISINNSRSFQRLKESEAKYRQTLESIVEGYYEIDCATKVCFANKALCQLLDYTFEQLIDSPFDRYFHADSERSLEDLCKSMCKDGRTVRFAHFKMIRKNRDLIPVDLSASPVIDSHGRIIGFRGLIRDATDRLNIEKEKKQLESKLLQAQKLEAIGKLAGGIAHNFNNWLNGILGNTALIRIDEQKGLKITDRLQKIESIIDSAAQMTQQLLGYARGGKYKIDQIDINKIIRSSADTFGVARKDISIELNLSSNVTAVQADKSQIEQVIWNLYANAVDAMPSGGKIAIETRIATPMDIQKYKHEIGDGNYMCMSFSDSGLGIEPKYLANIFEPFFTTKYGKGTGLGLASVYGIIKAHGGYIDVKSSVGQGSTFYVLLPLIKGNGLDDKKAKQEEIRAGGETILLVDDDDVILETCAQLLAEFGYTTLKALTGEEALEIYAKRAKNIDIVIIDMIMPGMSGKELYARLKKIDPDVKTLLSSGYALNEQAQEIIESGCNGFIQKPYNINQLCNTINNIVRPQSHKIA